MILVIECDAISSTRAGLHTHVEVIYPFLILLSIV